MKNTIPITAVELNRVFESVNISRTDKTFTFTVQNHIEGQSLENTTHSLSFNQAFEGKSQAFINAFVEFMREKLAQSLGITTDDIDGEL